MELLNKYKEHIEIQRALLLFFYNFSNHYNIIEEMKSENHGFGNAWDIMEARLKKEHEEKKSGWPFIIHFTDIYELFATKLSYSCQALLIEKVMKAYGKEAKESIDFSMELDAKAESVRKG